MNTLTEPADPKTLATAYALGEMSDAERAAFEAQMESDPALAALAEETKGFCALLDDSLCEPVPSLAEENRAALLTAANRKRKSRTAILIPWLAAGAAACVTGGFLFHHWSQKPDGGLVASRSTGSVYDMMKTAPDAGASVTPPAEPEKAKAGFARAPGNDLRYQPTLAIAPAIAPVSAPAPEVPAAPAAETVSVSTLPQITIKPAMPKPLFAGTPLPNNNPPQNLDKSGRPVLEMRVPADTVLVSKGAAVTSSDEAPLGELSWITDGDKEGDDGYFVDLLPGKQWVHIDLGKSFEIHLLWVWHFHKQAVIYKDVVVQVSDDPAFKTATTVFNNDYDNSAGFGLGTDLSWVETNNGRAMPVSGLKARYIRLWSNGRDIDDTNQYIEVEVYGREPGTSPPMLAMNETKGEVAQAGEKNGLAKQPAAEASAASGPAPAAKPATITVLPAMPKPLFAGTPLPNSNPPPNLDRRRAGYGGGYGTGRGAGIGSGYGPGSRGMPAKSALASAPATTTPAPEYLYKESDGFEGAKVAERRDYAVPMPERAAGAESYAALPENPFLGVMKAPLSTFSIDVDTASYSNVRRFLNMNQAPPPEAVRLEELVNYFPYDYAQPVDGKPFAVHVEMTSTPWNAQHRLARIALKGKEIHPGERPSANLVFLVDVSGSMQSENKLPLVKQSLRFVVERLTEKDTVSLVTYAGDSGVALPATSGADKARIMAAIDGLGAGGSTNGAGGINSAYAEAAKNFRKEGINRVILATDGDFNVGVTSHGDLQRLIEEKRATGVFLSVLGYGMGNTKDDTMELLSNKGNGNYAYIDSLSEARKALGEQFSGTLVTIAKDVKIQIEFNPAVIRSYRLLGYENRILAKEDFNNDKKDAGEIGAGHTVTAIYELVPVGAAGEPVGTVDNLKYQQPKITESAPAPAPEVPAEVSGETMTVKLRWKAPDADVSQLMEVPVQDAGAKIADASPETKWAVAVAGFASRLRSSQFAGMSWEDIRTLAKAGKGTDPNGYRGEFLQLLDKAESVRR